MGKIDAFAHILPGAYLARLEQQLERTMAPSQLAYYREGVFTFDPVFGVGEGAGKDTGRSIGWIPPWKRLWAPSHTDSSGSVGLSVDYAASEGMSSA